jgi:hypothetical protein
LHRRESSPAFLLHGTFGLWQIEAALEPAGRLGSESVVAARVLKAMADVALLVSSTAAEGRELLVAEMVSVFF